MLTWNISIPLENIDIKLESPVKVVYEKLENTKDIVNDRDKINGSTFRNYLLTSEIRAFN